MFFTSKKQKNRRKIVVKHTEEYEYILEWARRSRVRNSVKSLFDFIYRDLVEGGKGFNEEPLKTAWESLTDDEQISLTYELSKMYYERLVGKDFQ